MQPTHYDPMFILSLMGACLVDGSINPMSWTEIGKTNTLSIAIMAMSSKDQAVRSLAVNVLMGVWRALQV